MDKQLLVDAIAGCWFKTMKYASEMTNRGLAEFCGNQWNADWKWKKDSLMQLEISELQNIYKYIKN